jgi:hypothetical protein
MSPQGEDQDRAVTLPKLGRKIDWTYIMSKFDPRLETTYATPDVILEPMIMTS